MMVQEGAPVAKSTVDRKKWRQAISPRSRNFWSPPCRRGFGQLFSELQGSSETQNLEVATMSDTQLKRKRSVRDAAALPKRQKSDHLNQDTTTTTPKPVKTQTPKSTPKTQILDPVSTPTVILPQTAGSTDDNALQVATTPAQGKKARRGRDASRRKGADRVAVDQGQVVDKPQARVDGKSPWTLSKPLGGRFVLHDPIFAQDERYA